MSQEGEIKISRTALYLLPDRAGQGKMNQGYLSSNLSLKSTLWSFYSLWMPDFVAALIGKRDKMAQMDLVPGWGGKTLMVG